MIRKAARRPDAAAGHAASQARRDESLRRVSRKRHRSRSRDSIPIPAAPPLHRLNRTEYANSVRDLLEGRCRRLARSCPTDDMSHGFDNMADVAHRSRPRSWKATSAPPDASAAKPSAIPTPAPSPQPTPSRASLPRFATSKARRSARAAASPWSHDFPADGEYIFKIGFYYAATGALFGQNQGKGQQIEIAVNGARVALIEINPSITLAKDGIKTPPIHVKAGPQRISASFSQKFDGPHRRRISHGGADAGRYVRSAASPA